MFTNFSDLPPQSRLWVYQANRSLSDAEKTDLEKIFTDFVSHWQAHNHDLKAAFELRHDRFLLLAVDESFHAPSGCSIDKSVALLKEIHQKYGIDFLDRQVAYQNAQQIESSVLPKIKEKVKNGDILPQTLIFDNSISKKADLENWLKPAKNSWLERYF